MTEIYGKVYPFSNENLGEYNNIYDFDGRDVLTVVGSGDQYFVSVLYGAKNVDLFDQNNLAWFYFEICWNMYTFL